MEKRVWIWNWEDIWYPVNNKSDSVKPRADIMLYINAYSGKAGCFAINMCVEREKTPKTSKDESKKNENSCRYKAEEIIYKCSCIFCFVKTYLFRYSFFVSCLYFEHRKGLAGRKPISRLRQWLANPFGAAHLSLTDREISRSQIYWQLSESESGNLQPKSYWAHPPTGTEILAQNLQTHVFLQPGLRVHICNFIILCSLSRMQRLFPYNLCECIT